MYVWLVKIKFSLKPKYLNMKKTTMYNSFNLIMATGQASLYVVAKLVITKT